MELEVSTYINQTFNVLATLLIQLCLIVQFKLEADLDRHSILTVSSVFLLKGNRLRVNLGRNDGFKRQNNRSLRSNVSLEPEYRVNMATYP